MKVSQPKFLNARLSVVCAWSSLKPSQDLRPNAAQPIIILDDIDQKLLQELSDLDEYCSSIIDTPSRPL